MKQNRMSRAADRRAHLNLQIDLLAEQEITKLLQLELLICERLGVEAPLGDREIRDMSRQTAVGELAGRVRKRRRLGSSGSGKLILNPDRFQRAFRASDHQGIETIGLQVELREVERRFLLLVVAV